MGMAHMPVCGSGSHLGSSFHGLHSICNYSKDTKNQHRVYGCNYDFMSRALNKPSRNYFPPTDIFPNVNDISVNNLRGNNVLVTSGVLDAPPVELNFDASCSQEKISLAYFVLNNI